MTSSGVNARVGALEMSPAMGNRFKHHQIYYFLMKGCTFSSFFINFSLSIRFSLISHSLINHPTSVLMVISTPKWQPTTAAMAPKPTSLDNKRFFSISTTMTVVYHPTDSQHALCQPQPPFLFRSGLDTYFLPNHNHQPGNLRSNKKDT